MGNGYPERSGMIWTFDDLTRLIELYENGTRWGLIAHDLGRTVPACVIKLRAVRMFANFPKDLWRPRPIYKLKKLEHKGRQ